MQSHATRITQTLLAAGGTYRLRPGNSPVGLDAEMVAIIDLPGLTEDLVAEFQARLDASTAQGTFSIEVNQQVVGFLAEAGRLRIVRERLDVHRALPHWAAVRLYMGYYGGADLAAMGPMPWGKYDAGSGADAPTRDTSLYLPEPEAALFRIPFPKLWPVSWPDPDVWPWVIGVPYPPYQHEEGKTAEMKAEIDALRLPWMGY